MYGLARAETHFGTSQHISNKTEQTAYICWIQPGPWRFGRIPRFKIKIILMMTDIYSSKNYNNQEKKTRIKKEQNKKYALKEERIGHFAWGGGYHLFESWKTEHRFSPHTEWSPKIYLNEIFHTSRTLDEPSATSATRLPVITPGGGKRVPINQ